MALPDIGTQIIMAGTTQAEGYAGWTAEVTGHPPGQPWMPPMVAFGPADGETELPDLEPKKSPWYDDPETLPSWGGACPSLPSAAHAATQADTDAANAEW